MEFLLIIALVLAFGIPLLKAFNFKLGKEAFYVAGLFAALFVLIGIVAIFKKKPEPPPNLFELKQPQLAPGAVDVDFITADRVFPPGENIHAVALKVINGSEHCLSQVEVSEREIARGAPIARGTVLLEPPLQPGDSCKATIELRYNKSYSPTKRIAVESVVTTNRTRYYYGFAR